MANRPAGQPQDSASTQPTMPIPPPQAPLPTGDLSLLRGPPMGVPPMDTGVAQFVNDIRDVVPAPLKQTSWMYSANLVGLAAYSPRLAEATRFRYKEYIQYLKMAQPRSRMTPEYTLWLNNLRLLGMVQTARATRPDTERRLLTLQTSEVISSPASRGGRRKFLGVL